MPWHSADDIVDTLEAHIADDAIKIRFASDNDDCMNRRSIRSMRDIYDNIVLSKKKNGI